MTEELIDLSEFEPETVEALGAPTLEGAARDLAYTIGFIYQNKTPTADLEGVFEINDQFDARAREGKSWLNAALYYKFIEKSSAHTPASAALVATKHFGAVLRMSESGRWLEHISNGFMNTGVTEGFQVEAICGLLSKVNTLMRHEPDQWMLNFSTNNNRDHLMIMLVLAHTAVKNGVTLEARTKEDIHGFLDEVFCRLNQPGGFSTLNKLSHRFLTHESMSNGIDVKELSATEREKRLNTIVNPLFMIYANAAHKVQLFDTTAKQIFNELTTVLRPAPGKPQDVHLFNHEYARQLVMRTLMAPPEVWHEQLKRTTRKGNATQHVVNIENNLRGLLMELDSLSYEGEASLQKKVYNRLFEVLVPWSAKIKECADKPKLRLIELLEENVDFEARFKESRGLAKGLCTKYITESRRDLLGLLSRKERGRLIEDELGM